MKRRQTPILIAILAILPVGTWIWFESTGDPPKPKQLASAETQSSDSGEKPRPSPAPSLLGPPRGDRETGSGIAMAVKHPASGAAAKPVAGASATRLLSEEEWKARGEAAGLSLAPRRNFIRKQIPVELNFLPLAAARDRATGRVTFDLGLGVPAVGEVKRVVERSPDSYTLQGNLEDDPQSEFSVSVQEDVAVGTFSSSGFGIRQLRYAGRGIHLLQVIDDSLAPRCRIVPLPAGAERNQAALPPSEAPLAMELMDEGEEAPAGSKGAPPAPPIENMAGTTLDVMVVYSSVSLGQQGGLNAMLALINQGVDNTNQAFQASQVDAELRLVHTEEVTYFGSSGITALGALQSQSDGIMDQIHARRDEQGADFVSLWHEVTDVCGVGYIMTNLTTAFAPFAFNVTDPDCQYQDTFSHELGHNFGLAHAVGDAGTTQGDGLYNWSHGWRWVGNDSVQYRSIMAYSPGFRVRTYSNPNVFYQGTRSGVANLADSARSLTSAKDTMAAFRNSAGDDHGDTISAATPVGANSSTAGVLEVETDLDVFRIRIFSTDTLTVQTIGGTNTEGRLLNVSGGPIETDQNSGTGSNFLISRTVSPGIYYVEVSSQSNSTGPYSLVVELGGDDHGNDITSATPVAVPSTTAGVLEMGGDQDFFRVSVPAPGTLDVSTTGSTDTYGYLLDSSGSTLQEDDDSAGSPNFLISRFVLPGVYFIRVHGYYGSTTGAYSLVVSFTEVPDDHGDGFEDATAVTIGPISSPASTDGELEYGGDIDAFRFTIPAADPVEDFEMAADPIALDLNGFSEGNKTSLQQAGYTLRRVDIGEDFYYEDGAGISSNLPANGSGYIRLFADDSLEIVEDSGKAFDVISMDLAEYSTVFDSPQAITWRGHKAGGATETFTFLTDGVIDGTGPLADFEQVQFPDTFRDLVRLEAISVPCSVDNLVLEPSDARRVAIDIEGPPAQSAGSTSSIPIYQEKNFTLKPLGPIDTSSPYRLHRTGSGSSMTPDNGGAYLRLASGNSLEVFEDSNRAFDAIEVDLAEYSTSHANPASIEWKGYKADGTTVAHTFVTDGVIDGTGPLDDFETFVFPASFQNLLRLEAQTDLFSLDNLVVVSGSSGGINQGSLEISSTGSTDTVASLYNSSFNLLETNNNSGPGFNFLIQRDISPGTYYLKVSESGADAAGTYAVLFGYTAHEPEALSEPAGVTATDSSTEDITLTWDLVAAAESYSIHRHTANNSGASTTLASGLTGISFVDTTAAAEVTYYYWVRASNLEEESGFSLHDTGYRVAAAPVITAQPPNAPVESGQQSVLSVTATTGSGTISYQWYEGLTGDTSTPVGTNAATLSVPNQTVNTRYWVRVTNHIGSTDSQTANVTVLPNRPGRVIATENLFLDRVRITWESVATAVSYRIYRGTSSSFSSASLLPAGDTNLLHYEDTTATPGTRYWYFVKGVDPDGDEGYFLDTSTRDGVRAAGPLSGNAIPIRDVTDLVFDGQSAKLYISTDIGTVEQYDVASRTVPKSFYVGTRLRGIDITPDDSTLLVADLAEDGTGGKGFVHRILPASSAVATLEYDLEVDEGGSFDVGIFSNSSAFLTTETTGSADLPIRELNPATGVFSIRGDAPGSGGGGLVGERSGIVRNSARTDGVFLEANDGAGPWFAWDPSGGGSFGPARLSGSAPYRGAVNQIGALVALSNYPGAKVFAPNGSLVRDLGGNAAGMCFSPLVDELYVADFQANRIRGYDTASWLEEFDLVIPGGIAWNPQLGEGTLEISPDGRILALATDDEVRLFDISARVTPPVAPVNVSATDNLNDRVRVTWGATVAADSYRVYRSLSDDSGTASLVAGPLTGFTWDDTTAIPVTTYYYWVKAANGFGEGDFSASDPGVLALTAPTGLTATTDRLDGIKIDWNADPGVSEYWVNRHTSGSGISSTKIATVTAGTTYTDNTIDPGRDYYYFVRAVANGNPSPYSGFAVGRRLYPAPAAVAATDASFDDKVRINWGDIGGAVEYVIYRNTTASEIDAEEIGRPAGGTLSYDDISATPGTPYFYAVRAVLPGGEESVLSDWEEGELSAVPTFLPDELIGRRPAVMLGNGVYNTTAAGQTVRLRSKRRKVLRFYCVLENDGALADTLVVAATRRNRLFRAVYFEIPAGGGRANVTAAAVTGTYLAALGPGERGAMRLDVKRKGKKNRRLKRKVFSVFTRSQNAPGRQDAVKGKAESG